MPLLRHRVGLARDRERSVSPLRVGIRCHRVRHRPGAVSCSAGRDSDPCPARCGGPSTPGRYRDRYRSGAAIGVERLVEWGESGRAGRRRLGRRLAPTRRDDSGKTSDGDKNRNSSGPHAIPLSLAEQLSRQHERAAKRLISPILQSKPRGIFDSTAGFSASRHLLTNHHRSFVSGASRSRALADIVPLSGCVVC